MTSLAVKNDAIEVAASLLGGKEKARQRFAERLLEVLEQAEGKDFLVIHNPGGWGCSSLESCLEWERSIVEGVKSTIDRMGYSSALTQYFRTRDSLISHFLDTREQARIFLRGKYTKAKFLAAELQFVTKHASRTRVVMVGVSQGAGFSNAVMKQLNQGDRIYSIELGMMFIQVPRRLRSDHTLAVDGNGMVPDPIVHRDLWAGARAYTLAPVRWLKYQIIRQPRRFTKCVIMPGHDYSWDYPGVRKQIEEFLRSKFSQDLEETNI